MVKKKLAIHGAPPLRKNPFPGSRPGASVIGKEERDAVLEVLENRSLFRYYGEQLLGKVKAFEEAFAEKIGAKYALGVTSGTAALVVALKALGISIGDHVLVPAASFIATPAAVLIAGGVPGFVDLDNSLTMDPEDLERKIIPETKAVIPVALRGNPCKMDRIMKTASKYNLLVLEDVAQSCGSMFRGKVSGTFGNAGAFSLQQNKMITTGDGGVVTTDDPNVYERAVRYHDGGMFREREGFLNVMNDDQVFVGQNYRMNEMSGAVALEQLKKLDSIISRTKEIITTLRNGIAGIPGITLCDINDLDGYAGSTLVFMLPDEKIADKFIEALKAEGIPAGKMYGGKPLYRQPQFAKKKTIERDNFPFSTALGEKADYSPGICPRAEDILRRNVSIEVNPLFTREDTEDILMGIEKVSDYYLR